MISPRRSLKWPITLGVVMIVLLTILIIGWVLLTIFGAVTDEDTAPLFWTLLPIGATFLVLVLVGVVMYLAMSIKAVNLNRRQSNFIDSVTHELKSPIASLKMYLQTLNRRQVNADDRDAFYGYMLKDVERLDHLINHLLDAARLEKSLVSTDAKNIDIAQLLRDCAEGVRVRYRTAPETFHFDLQRCTVYAQRGDVEVLFRNLIDNAVKYADVEPRVAISLKYENGFATVSISDNGLGVPQDMRRRIFTRFERLGSELERKKTGTGLGLYIVKTLVARLKGRIEVDDRPDGTGAVFRVRLPAQPVQDEKAKTHQEETTHAYQGAPLKT